MKNDVIIFGRNAVKEAIRARKVVKICGICGLSDASILDLVKQNKIPYSKISRKEMDALCDGVHQGVMAYIKPYEYSSFEAILALGKKVERPIILLLDGINDPHNLGAIIRSADVFGVTGILLPKRNEVSLTSTVAKSSAGAINFVPVALVSNLNNAIKSLKDNGYWVVSTDGMATTNYQDVDYNMPVALVIGSEGYGVSPLIVKNSDFVVKIPMFGHVNSLNASVATGILLANIRR